MSHAGYLIASGVLALLSSVVANVGGEPRADDKARKLMDQAVMLISSKSYELADARLVDALAVSPPDSHAVQARLRCLRVLALRGAGRTCEAREELRFAEQERAKLSRVPDAVGECFAQLAEVQQVTSTCPAPAHSDQRCREGMVEIPGGTYNKRQIKNFCMDVHEVTVEAFGYYVAGLETQRLPAKGPKRTKAAVGLLRSSLLTVSRERISQQDRPDEKAHRDRNCNWGGGEAFKQHPINCVSVVEAAAYCHAFGKRLPTQQEWKWAARGGTSARTYPGPFTRPTPADVNMAADAKDIYKRTMRVGSFRKSEFGLHDLAGNVAEWTACTASDSLCFARGGHFRHHEERYFRVANEEAGETRETRSVTIGFRCVSKVNSKAPRSGSQRDGG